MTRCFVTVLVVLLLSPLVSSAQDSDEIRRIENELELLEGRLLELSDEMESIHHELEQVETEARTPLYSRLALLQEIKTQRALREAVLIDRLAAFRISATQAAFPGKVSLFLSAEQVREGQPALSGLTWKSQTDIFGRLMLRFESDEGETVVVPLDAIVMIQTDLVEQQP